MSSQPTNIAGYKFCETITRNHYRVIHRVEDKTGMRFLLKMLIPESVDNNNIASLKKEYNQIKKFKSNYLAQAVSLNEFENLPIILLEDIGGVNLKTFASLNTIENLDDIKRTLNITQSIAQGLAIIHNENLKLNNLSLNHLIYNIDNHRLNFIEFNQINKFTDQQELNSVLNFNNEQLAYISPEQTGLMNRKVDFRSDFYSLGICFYELFCNKSPLSADSPRAWMHKHTSKKIIAPHLINKVLPVKISEIIMKLLEKNAEARYQSISSLLYDLTTSIRLIDLPDKLNKIILGTKDVIRKFHLTTTLYGRKHEIELIKNRIDDNPERVCIPILIKGEKSIGKTSLLKEIQEYVFEKKGCWIGTSIDNKKNKLPLTGLSAAFTDVLNNILDNNYTEFTIWKQKLLTALDNKGQLLIEFIPKLEEIIGKQASVIELPIEEANLRFRKVLTNFIFSFYKLDHPFVLAVDNIQWLDISSIKIIQHILNTKINIPFVFIGTYQPFEKVVFPELYNFIDQIEQKYKKSKIVEIKGLKFEEISQLIRDAYKCNFKEARKLAEICFEKTKGTPPLVHELLKNLNQQGHIKQTETSWFFDIEKIQFANTTHNIANAISKQIHELDEQTIKVLFAAACIGMNFNANLICKLTNLPIQTILKSIGIAVKHSLICPNLETDNQKHLFKDTSIQYKFYHERIYEIIDDLIAKLEKAELHIKIGQFMLANESNFENQNYLFLLLSHLKYQKEFKNELEQIHFSRLNLKACKKAKLLGLNSRALYYAEEGIALLNEKTWNTDYELAFLLYKEAAELSLFTNNYNRTKGIIEIAIRKSNSNLECAELSEFLIQAHIANNQKQLAVKVAIDILRTLNIHIPQKNLKIHIRISFNKIEKKIKNGAIEELLSHGFCTDKEQICAARIIASLIPIFDKGDKIQFSILILTLLNLSFKVGILSKTPIALIGFGILNNLKSINKFEKTLEICDIALSLLSKNSFMQNSSQALCLYNCNISPWHKSIYEVSIQLLENVKNATDLGEYEISYTSLITFCYFQFFSGTDLLEIEKIIKEEVKLQIFNNLRLNQQQFEVLIQTINCLVLNLDTVDNDIKKQINQLDEIQKIELLNNNIPNLYIHFNKLFLAIIFRQVDMIDQFIKNGRRFLKNNKSLYIYAQFIIYETLGLLLIYKTQSIHKRLQTKRRIFILEKKIKNWITNAPINFNSKYFLIKAEIERIFKNGKNALKYYGLAIENSLQNKFVQDEALIHEMCGFYLESIECNFDAKSHFEMSLIAYKKWGATAKLSDIESKIFRFKQFNSIERSNYDSGNYDESSSYFQASNLELDTIVDIAQSLSSEINYYTLIEKTIEIVIEQAGADKCILLVQNNKSDELMVEVKAYYENDKLVVKMGSQPISETILPVSIVLKAKRTLKKEIIGDASNHMNYKQIGYIEKNKIKSILILPLIKQSILTGIIYLENNSAIEAFNEKQIKLLDTISSFIASSIDNARLYVSLEQIVETRTEELKISNEKLKQSNSTKDMFFKIISHDLRSPIGTLVSIVDLYDTEQKESEKIKLHEIIKTQVKINYQQLDMLLLWAQSQQDELKFQPKEELVYELVERVKNLYESTSIAKKIRVENIVQKEVTVVCDQNLIYTVLRNLIGNALKFTNNGGLIKIIGVKEKDCLRIEVIDNGLGMNQITISSLFRIDKKQASRKGTNNENGTGLGLILCAEFIEKYHKGKIWAKSIDGIGSTFSFTIPFNLKINQ